MPSFSFDWPKTKQEALRGAKGNRELEDFLDGLFGRLDDGLSLQLAQAGEDASICDQYAAIHAAQLLGRQSLTTLRGARWPGGSDSSRELLHEMFRTLAAEAKPLKRVLLKQIDKIKQEQLLLYKKWRLRKPTTIPIKPLDAALKEWQAETNGNFGRALEAAKRLPAKERQMRHLEIDTLLSKIADAADELIGKRARQKEHKGLLALLERMQAEAEQARAALKALGSG